MSEIVKGILGGGLTLVAGWILPTALNLLLIGLFVLPSPGESFLIGSAQGTSAVGKAALLLGASVVIGLVLNMLQTPLYRLLEGYLLWPQWAFEKRKQRHQARKAEIATRIAAIRGYHDELEATASSGETDHQRRVRIAAISNSAGFREMRRKDQRRSASQRALLREQLRRYPVDDDQVLPTWLGNAIRRFEEYGWNHYRLDSQSLWSRLISVVPDQCASKLIRAE